MPAKPPAGRYVATRPLTVEHPNGKQTQVKPNAPYPGTPPVWVIEQGWVRKEPPRPAPASGPNKKEDK